MIQPSGNKIKIFYDLPIRKMRAVTFSPLKNFAPEIPSNHKHPQQFRMPIIHEKPILSSKLATIKPCIHSLILARGILPNNNKIQRYNDDTI